jgi:hypothetical protein
VAKGFAQRPGIVNETFAPTELSSLHTLYAIGALEDLHIDLIDITTAFLNGDVDFDIYVDQPDGFQQGDLVCKLKRSLYGLKQAPRLWYKKLDELFASLGFIHTHSDHSLFIYQHKDTKVCILVYVDDLTLACKDRFTLDKVKEEGKAV